MRASTHKANSSVESFYSFQWSRLVGCRNSKRLQTPGGRRLAGHLLGLMIGSRSVLAQVEPGEPEQHARKRDHKAAYMAGQRTVHEASKRFKALAFKGIAANANKAITKHPGKPRV